MKETNKKRRWELLVMSSNDDAMEVALLAIAKDLLQASDDLAPTDPSASAKLAHEAYEIGRDLGIVRNHLDDDDEEVVPNALALSLDQAEMPALNGIEAKTKGSHAGPTPHARREIEDDADADLFRILDRQKAMLPTAADVQPMRQANHNARSMTFESTPPRRSSWFGWMRSREWRHAG